MSIGKKALIAVAVVIALWFLWFIVGQRAITEPEEGMISHRGDPEPSTLSAESLKADGITSKAEWIASNPRTTPAQIAMVCELPTASARRYDQELGQTFDVDTLARLRTDCKG